MPEDLDLDALVERARLDAATRRSDEAAAAAVLRLLAEADGAMPLDALLRAGARREVVAALVDPDASTDKRRKQRARLGIVGDVPTVWLTATGWQATGRSSGREVVPTADTITHAMAPARLAAWLATRNLAAYGVSVRATWGPSCRRWSEEVSARAWARLRTAADGSGTVGALTGGLIPDALLVEGWSGPQAAAFYQQAWGVAPESQDDLTEVVVAVEVEDSRKAADPLRSKVDRWDAALGDLAAARAVLWVVRTREVADRLRGLGVDDPQRRPWQVLVPGPAVGLGGEDIGPVQRTWWPQLVPAQQG